MQPFRVEVPQAALDDLADRLSRVGGRTSCPASFHPVIPSLPGFGFSGPTRSTGWNRYRTARAWARLMAQLGYERLGAVGNDAGSMISPELGRIDPEHVVGVHVTQLFSFPSGGARDDCQSPGIVEDSVKRLCPSGLRP